MEFGEEEALELVNDAIAKYRGKSLNNVETAILCGSWRGQTYQEIGKNYGYSSQYLQRDAGPKFWKELSKALGEPIKKKNVRAALGRKWRDRSTKRRDRSSPADVIGTISSLLESGSSLSESQGRQAGWDREPLYGALLRLNYFQQVKLFKKFLASGSVGACLIQGDKECGQQWLLNRLVQFVPGFNAAKVVSFNLSRKTRANSSNALWRELAGRVGLLGEHPLPKIAEAVWHCWQSQPVILIFHAVDEIPQESLREFMGEFWVPVAKMASNLPEARFSVGDAPRDAGRESGYPLLMFLVDYSGSIGDSDMYCVESLEAGWQSQIPLKLPRIGRIGDRELAAWIENAVDELPFQLTENIDRAVSSILEQSENGLPQWAIEEICRLCDCNWYDKETIWLKH